MGEKSGPRLGIEVNGRRVEAERGENLLRLLDTQGIHVPRLCHDPRLRPSGACRMCEVRIEGRRAPVAACATQVEEGMRVTTHTPELESYRRSILTMLARSYPKEEPGAIPETSLQRYFRDYGVEARGESVPPQRFADLSHPYIAVDMRRCISCFRCIHICDDLQGQFVWKLLGRGAESRILPDSGTTLLESSCVSCGACVDTCPSGALLDQTALQQGHPASWQRTTCPYCGVGCELNVGVRDGQIVNVRPVIDAPVSKGHLCVKGRYAFRYVDAGDRITRPMLRRDGAWEPVSWEAALDAAAGELLRVRKEFGPDAIGVIGSARATNEESFLAHKLARAVIGTNNVDCCARVCHAPSAAGLGALFGTGAATNSFDDIERAASFLVFGSDPCSNHPVVGARIRQRALAGIPLIVADPRRTELAGMATVHLALRPGTNIPLLQGLAAVIVEEALLDEDFIRRRSEGFSEFRESLRAWSAERAAEICDIEPRLIREAARIYARARPAMCFHGLGVTEHIQGTDAVIALGQLALLTGNVGRPGAGVNPLRGQNNVQGTAVMGCEPNKLTGSQSFALAGPRHEELWGVKLPKAPGLDAIRMIDAAAEGKLKAMLVFGYDLLLTHPNMRRTEQALQRLGGVIVVDLFLTETAKSFGTVFLPACSSFEKEGSFMNAERRIQRVRQALRPRGEARSDLEITGLLADRLGGSALFRNRDAESVWNEIRSLWPAVKGMSYARLDRGGLQWPCPEEDHPGTGVLHATAFPLGPKAAFRPLSYRPSAEERCGEYPLILNTGRSLYHFNAATMSGRTRNRELEPDDLIRIHPDDALALGVKEGARVTVRSRHGSFSGRARLAGDVRKGELFSSFHCVEALVNRVTGDGRDPVTHTPEYKVTAVRIEPG